MSKKKEKKIDWENLEPEEQLKYEIAEELGLLDRVKEEGWKSLSAKETGRIGGLMTRRKQEMKARALKGEQEEMLEELQ
ncbi:MAG: small, acid-soluble spore protein, alpha/beta type [Lachnospiraceae bacterium]|nr:small, acid-soluble spore protein, alpha/beta type [Lachnospiraceae bacterium]MCI8996360.1 small, acid-soluble spore protein, alpha/beta type [Lachnospiraceae bacterium]MCI9133964.1 small, acid-soluble spore protein, alpha/beta type [Lachnospiraceae bacterium]